MPFLLVSCCTSALILSPLAIPLANYTIQKPVFFGGAKKDYVAIAAAGKATTAQFCKGPLTIHEFDAGHWLIAIGQVYGVGISKLDVLRHFILPPQFHLVSHFL